MMDAMAEPDDGKWRRYLESLSQGSERYPESVNERTIKGYFDEFVDHDLAPRTYIVNPEVNCMSTRVADTMSCKSWVKSHGQMKSGLNVGRKYYLWWRSGTAWSDLVDLLRHRGWCQFHTRDLPQLKTQGFRDRQVTLDILLDDKTYEWLLL